MYYTIITKNTILNISGNINKKPDKTNNNPINYLLPDPVRVVDPVRVSIGYCIKKFKSPPAGIGIVNAPDTHFYGQNKAKKMKISREFTSC